MKRHRRGQRNEGARGTKGPRSTGGPRRIDAEFAVLYAKLRADHRLDLVARFVAAFARGERLWSEEPAGPLSAVWFVTASVITFHALGSPLVPSLRVWW